jgi:hypothetical protein
MNSGLVGALGAAPLRVTGMTKRVVTSGPNADANALQLQATGGSKNVDLVLTPKGTGALIVGPAPDGTIIGGNKRAIGAVDLQLARTAANQVAGGYASAILSGTNNKIGVGGVGSIFSRCVIIGGDSNDLTQGNPNTSLIGCGTNNSIGSPTSCILGGTNNSIGSSSATSSVIGAGVRNVIGASGAYGGVLCGESNSASANSASVLGGIAAIADRYAMQAHSAGSFINNAVPRGDAQNVKFVMRNKTTTNSAVELFLDGSSIRLTIPSGKAMHAAIKIIGIKSDGTSTAAYIRQVAIKNVAGTTSLIGVVTTIGSDTAAGTSISITENDVNDALKIEVTGITSETWRWVAVVDGVEVVYGT